MNIPAWKLHFIDPLLKILDLDILNPPSTLGCRNGGVALDMKSLLHFLPDHNFPRSKTMDFVVNTAMEICITLCRSTLIHWFDWRSVWFSSMGIRFGSLPIFFQIPKWKINIILGSGHRSCQTIKAQYHAHYGYPNHPTKSDLQRKIDAGRCDVTRL